MKSVRRIRLSRLPDRVEIHVYYGGYMNNVEHFKRPLSVLFIYFFKR